MIPLAKDLVIYQGSTFKEFIEWVEGDMDVPSTLEPVEINNYQAVMHIRQTYDSNLLCEITSNAAEIVIDSDAYISITISAEKTAKLPWKQPLMYDIKIINLDTMIVYRVVEGKIIVKPEITKVTLPSS